MASDWSVLHAQELVCYPFRDLSLLRKALTAGDINSADREGHRGMAQLGDALMSAVIMSEGFDRGISRKSQQETSSLFKSKERCSTLARALRLDTLIKISDRQVHDGAQPTTLKNTLAAVVAAVWLDSRDYCTLVGVMASLGLVNNTTPSPSSWGGMSSTWASLSTSGTCLDTVSGNLDASIDGFDLDSFVGADMFRPERGSTLPDLNMPDDRSGGNWLPDLDVPQSSLHLVPDANFELSEKRITADALGSGVSCYVQPGPDPPVTSGAQKPHNEVGVLHMEEEGRSNRNTNAPSCTSHSGKDVNSNTTATNPTAHSRSTSHASTTSNDNFRISKRKKAFSESHPSTAKHSIPIHSTVNTYLAQESHKLKHRPASIFNQYYSHMNDPNYLAALTSLPARHPKALATLSTAVGDCSALVLLRQAISSLRLASAPASQDQTDPTTSLTTAVGRPLTPEARLAAIHQLDLCMAHLRLVRWLHIHTLYEDLAHDIGGGVDGFILVTDADVAASSDATAKPRRGNPRNLEKTDISARISGAIAVGADPAAPLAGGRGRAPDQTKTGKSIKQLRRVGQRLSLLVQKWGIGVLCLLGARVTDDLIMDLSDATFAKWIDAVDRFEGDAIRAVSDAAAAAVRLFTVSTDAEAGDHGAGGRRQQQRQDLLRIETVGEEEVALLPRLSEEMREMFLPSSAREGGC